MRIGVLVCDHVDPPLDDIGGDYIDMFAALVLAHAPDAELVAYDMTAGEAPASPTECDAWLATGSRRSVYDDLQWIRQAEDVVRQIHRSGKPFVGICFGHQLLAAALGGTVAKAPGGWGVGAHRVELSPEEWMGHDDCTLLFMHQDQVIVPPDGAVVLGKTDHCDVAMLRVGNMVGVQAHPEFPVDYIRALLVNRVERVGAEKTETALASLGDPLDAAAVGGWIVRFLERT